MHIKQILYNSFSLLTETVKRKEIPVLLYPLSYAEKESISYEKLYVMWIINLQKPDNYLKFIDRLFRFASK